MTRRSKYDEVPATLTEALNMKTVDSLKRYLKLLAQEKQVAMRKAELVKEVRSRMRGAKLRSAWAKLDDNDKAALAEAVHDSSGVLHFDRFQAKYPSAKPGISDRPGSSIFGHEFTLASLFFHNSRIPDDLRKELKTFIAKPDEASLATCESLPSYYTPGYDDANGEKVQIPLVTRHMEAAAQHDLQATLRFIDTGKLLVSEKTRQPTTASCKSLGKLMSGGEFFNDEFLKNESESRYYEAIGPIRAFAWPLLLQAGGVSQATGKQLRLGKTGRKAMSDPPEATLRRLWQRWLKGTVLDEFRRVDAIKGQTGKAKRGFTALAGRRKAIAWALQECPVGKWVQVDRLFNHMQATGNDFDVTRDPWRIYITDSHYGSLGYDGFHDWNFLQGRYALCVLFEYAATLGMIDVAYVPPHHARPDYTELWGTDDMQFLSRYDGLQYLRLTPLGAYCLGVTEEYVTSEPEHRTLLEVMPNMEVININDSLDAADCLLLDSFARRLSEPVWKLDQATLLKACEQGRDLEQFQQFLLSRTAKALPGTVARLLNDTLKRSSLLQDKGSVRLIECADPDIAEMIANNNRCKKLCKLAGQHHLVVHPACEARFRTAVRKLGYSLPNVE